MKVIFYDIVTLIILDGQRFEENSNIKLKNNEIKHFHKAIENIKNQINQTYNPNIGQRMRGESAKKLYVAQTIKHDTVDGYNSKINQKKDNSSISVKKSEIYILKSMPKSMVFFEFKDF